MIRILVWEKVQRIPFFETPIFNNELMLGRDTIGR